MGDNKSAYLSDENIEWLEDNDVNFSQLVDEFIERQRMSASKSSEDMLEQQIAEKKDEIAEKQDELEELETELEELEAELEHIREKQEEQVEEVVNQLAKAVLVAPDSRAQNDYKSYPANCGLTQDQFNDLVQHVDLHAVNPQWWWSDDEKAEDAVNFADDTTEANIIPVEIQNRIDKDEEKITKRDLRMLTDEQEQAARQWVNDEL